jgi:hypothetical protein
MPPPRTLRFARGLVCSPLELSLAAEAPLSATFDVQVVHLIVYTVKYYFALLTVLLALLLLPALLRLYWCALLL